MSGLFPLALPEGTILAGQYIIQKTLGQGGFGITYMALDHKSGGRVAVKEFFPDTLATRLQNTVSSYPGERGESFEYGKQCFLQEAETLAQFIGSENIVRIHSYFEENGTAYFVMDFVEGISFDEYIRQKGGKIPYADAERILLPVMSALALVHSKGIVHRDVTPDNIYITNEGAVKLLDFGAARYSLGDKSRSLDVVLKHGFAPKEQYTRHGKQGPFTDVYTVGASFYYAITGRRPPDSIDRLEEDDLIPPSSLGVAIAPQKEDAILKAMNVQPGERFRTMTEFAQALSSGGPQPDPGQAQAEQRFFATPEPQTVSQPVILQSQMGAQSAMPQSQMGAQPVMPQSQMGVQPVIPQSQMVSQPVILQSQMGAQSAMPQSQMGVQPVMPQSQMSAQPVISQSQMVSQPVIPQSQMGAQPVIPQPQTDAASMAQSPNPAPFQGQAAQSVQSRAPLGNADKGLPKQPAASNKKWLPFIIGGGVLGLILFLTVAGLAIRTMLRRGDTGLEGTREANALAYKTGDSDGADTASLPEENGGEGDQETPDARVSDEQLGEIESLLEEGRKKIEEEDYYNGAVPCLENGMDLCLSLGADYGSDERLAAYAQELYDEYELCILTYHVPMLEEQGLQPELYEQVDSELEELCGRADSLTEAGLLEPERGDNAREALASLPEWYTRQYCLAFNEFTQRENWSRTEAWEMMSGAKEAGLIKEDDPDDALRLRYGYALARFTLKQNEENIEKGEYEEAKQRIIEVLKEADYNPMLIIELYSLEEELGNEEGEEAALNCLSDMQQTVYQMQGVDILDDPEHFWYFNDFGEYSVSDDNGLTPQARGRMRELGQYYYG